MVNEKKVLIAEDEEDISWAVSRCLVKSNFNFNVECVNNGDDAYELLQQEPFDLLISDVRMPKRDGFQLTRDALALLPDIKIIVMTAYSSPDVVNKIGALNGISLVEKPFELEQLKQLVFDTLNLSEDQEYRVTNSDIRAIVSRNCSRRKNMSLFVSGDEKNGAIYLEDGKVVHAVCGRLTGEVALKNILNWNNGKLSVGSGNNSVSRTIDRDWRTLLRHFA